MTARKTLGRMLSWEIANKLTWMYEPLWYMVESLEAKVRVFDCIDVPVHLRFIRDHEVKHMEFNFFCINKQLQKLEETIGALNGRARDLQKGSDGVAERLQILDHWPREETDRLKEDVGFSFRALSDSI